MNCESLDAVFLPPTITPIDAYAFYGCESLRFFNLPESIEHRGHGVFEGCGDQLHVVSTTTASNNLSKVCYSTSITPQMIQECIDTHGIERASTEQVNDDQQMAALHILCASNPHVTGDCIRIYMQLSPEAAELDDSNGMTPFQCLCRNDITFLRVEDERSFSSLMAWWYGCMPPQTDTSKKRKRG